jgi:hypothetical protein
MMMDKKERIVQYMYTGSSGLRPTGAPTRLFRSDLCTAAPAAALLILYTVYTAVLPDHGGLVGSGILRAKCEGSEGLLRMCVCGCISPVSTHSSKQGSKRKSHFYFMIRG